MTRHPNTQRALAGNALRYWQREVKARAAAKDTGRTPARELRILYDMLECEITDDLIDAADKLIGKGLTSKQAAKVVLIDKIRSMRKALDAADRHTLASSRAEKMHAARGAIQSGHAVTDWSCGYVMAGQYRLDLRHTGGMAPHLVAIDGEPTTLLNDAQELTALSALQTAIAEQYIAYIAAHCEAYKVRSVARNGDTLIIQSRTGRGACGYIDEDGQVRIHTVDGLPVSPDLDAVQRIVAATQSLL